MRGYSKAGCILVYLSGFGKDQFAKNSWGLLFLVSDKFYNDNSKTASACSKQMALWELPW
jgi:hypothetical protein